MVFIVQSVPQVPPKWIACMQLDGSMHCDRHFSRRSCSAKNDWGMWCRGLWVGGDPHWRVRDSSPRRRQNDTKIEVRRRTCLARGVRGRRTYPLTPSRAGRGTGCGGNTLSGRPNGFPGRGTARVLKGGPGCFRLRVGRGLQEFLLRSLSFLPCA